MLYGFGIIYSMAIKNFHLNAFCIFINLIIYGVVFIDLYASQLEHYNYIYAPSSKLI